MIECEACGRITRKGVRISGETMCPDCAEIIYVLVYVHEADRLEVAEEEES